MKKLDAKELRIGNWVNADVGLPSLRMHEILPQDISYIAEEKVSVYGIPLTEEILLKCGFEGKNNWFSKKDILLGYTTSDNFLQIEYRFSGGDWIVLDLKYLHQLKNLYYCLCGEELEVNLDNS